MWKLSFRFCFGDDNLCSILEHALENCVSIEKPRQAPATLCSVLAAQYCKRRMIVQLHTLANCLYLNFGIQDRLCSMTRGRTPSGPANVVHFPAASSKWMSIDFCHDSSLRIDQHIRSVLSLKPKRIYRRQFTCPGHCSAVPTDPSKTRHGAQKPHPGQGKAIHCRRRTGSWPGRVDRPAWWRP